MPITQKTVLELLASVRNLADFIENLERQSHRAASDMKAGGYRRFIQAEIKKLHDAGQAELQHAKLVALRDEVPADKVNVPWEDETKKPD